MRKQIQNTNLFEKIPMLTMAMTHEEQERLEEIESKVNEMHQGYQSMKAQVSSIYNVITGQDPMNKHLPIMERVAKLERSQWVVKVVIVAFGIGLIVGALVFGAITFKQFVEAVKAVK
jgi:subtilase family serine protease